MGRYLQLPDSFSARIRELAQQITAEEQTPFDKALAITRYLRENIVYETNISALPEGKDPLEWFLFDSQKGFCNYYASAEVLMLRSIGVPARLSVGFAEGEAIEGSDRFQVKYGDSHAWPEIYFPGYGWVEFEPTASQPMTSLLPDRVDTTSDENERQRDEGDESGFGLNNQLKLDLEGDELLTVEPKPFIPPTFIVLFSAALFCTVIGSWFYIRRRTKGPDFDISVMIEKFFVRRGIKVPDGSSFWLIAHVFHRFKEYFLKSDGC